MPGSLLVVDTNRETLAALSGALTDAGFAVTPAGDFEDAVALLKTRRYDFLVTAERLGAHNGLHLVLRARAENPSVAAVISTVAPDAVLAVEAANFGAGHIVAPSEHSASLVALLRELKDVQPL